MNGLISGSGFTRPEQTKFSWRRFLYEAPNIPIFQLNCLFRRFESEYAKNVADDYEEFFIFLTDRIKSYFDNPLHYSLSPISEEIISVSFAQVFFAQVDRDSREYKAFWQILSETIWNRLPDGEIVGYKKALAEDSHERISCCIVKLGIPKDAKRSKAFGKKCRCDKAFVEDIYWRDCESSDARTYKYDIAHSSHDVNFEYKRGEWVSMDNFDDCPWVECSAGIHFFESEEDAYNYIL